MLLFRTLFVALAALIVTFAMVNVTHAQTPAPAAAIDKLLATPHG